MKRRRIISVLLLVNLFGFAAYGQGAEWRNYVDSSGELWFQAPASILIDRDSELKAVTLHTFFEGVKASVRKQEIKDEPIKYVKGLSLPFGLPGSNVRNYKFTDFYVRREDEMYGSDLHVTIYAGSKKSYFVITLIGSNDNPTMKLFSRDDAVRRFSS
jgi:hypothetical protein